jgi:hypothetical protein
MLDEQKARCEMAKLKQQKQAEASRQQEEQQAQERTNKKIMPMVWKMHLRK